MASRGVGVRRRWIFGKRRTGLRAKEHRYCDTERRSACEKALYQDYRPHACRLAFQRGNGWMHKNPLCNVASSAWHMMPVSSMWMPERPGSRVLGDDRGFLARCRIAN